MAAVAPRFRPLQAHRALRFMVHPSHSDGIRVFVIGPPAAGKSTFCKLVSAELGARGVMAASLRMDDILRRRHPPTTRRAGYCYDDSGALVLHDPRRQIRAALKELAKHCREAATRGSFVAEFMPDDVISCFECFASPLVDGSLVVFISAPVAVRRRRNLKRDHQKIPDHRMALYPANLLPDQRRWLIEHGACVAQVKNNGSVGQLIRRAKSIVGKRV